jgi:hypothetical protein
MDADQKLALTAEIADKSVFLVVVSTNAVPVSESSLATYER